MTMTRRTQMLLIAIPVCLAVIIAVILTTAHEPSIASTTLTSNYPTVSRAPTSTRSALTASPALAKLAIIPVRGRAPKTNYDRALFGSPWTDDVTVEGGHNGCDTRNDVLRRDLTGVGFKPARKACVVLSGTLHDPYTGETILYQRGPGTSSRIQVDHIVPILDAWQKGAQGWDYMTRRNFANDPINLQATTAAANDQKGSGDAATWLPPNDAYRCTYAIRIIDVKAKYGLWATQPEHDALARIIGSC